MLKGLGFIDELHWEGAGTVGVHLIYVGFDAVNPHAPELYGGLDIGGLSPSAGQAAFEAAISNALKQQLIGAHGFTFEAGDTVQVMGTALSAAV